LREGKSLGSDKGKALESRLFYEQRKEVERGFTAYDPNFNINVARATLGRSFDVNSGKAACEACSAVDQHSICSRIEENRGEL
jgi:hypothetical protein